MKCPSYVRCGDDDFYDIAGGIFQRYVCRIVCAVLTVLCLFVRLFLYVYPMYDLPKHGALVISCPRGH